MASDSNVVAGLKIMSYNMHGFHQGCPTLNDAIVQYSPDLILLQEHWLTPANLYLFDSHFVNYFSFGSSAMSEKVEVSEWVSSFLTAHQHIIGYSVPYNGLENAIKEGKYNQGYLATIKYE